jgi:hypothetical protein
VQRSGSPDVAGEHHERAPEGLGRDPARLVDTLTQPGDHHVAREILEPTRPVRLGNEQAGRVRPLVHGRHSARALVVDRLDRPRHPRPDHVIAAGEVVSVVRVEALQALAGPTHPAVLLGVRIVPCSFTGVLGVSACDRVREVGLHLEPFVQPRDPALRLQT